MGFRYGCFLFAFLAVSVAYADPATDLQRPRRGPSQVRLGETAPSILAHRLRGSESVVLENLRGQVVVLDFWATWCRPCREIMPELGRWQRVHHAQGLRVVGISSEARTLIQSFLPFIPGQYAIAQVPRETFRRYRVSAIPMMVLIGRDGKVRAIHVGVSVQGMRMVEAEVRTLLAEPSPG